MKQKITFLLSICFILFYAACNSSGNTNKQLNLDAAKASPGIFKLLLENEHVRVLEYSLKPGEKDNWHTHPAKSSYVVSGGKLKVYLENGDTIIADEKAGTASWMDYVGKHYVENIGTTTFGWKPVGTVKTVTKSEGNHVYTIDDTPVLDTIKYGGQENVTRENFAMEHSIALTIPLQRETGDAVALAGLVVDWNDHSIYWGGPVPQGSKVRFSLPPDFKAIEKVIKGCEELKATEIPEADALILSNCAGRLLEFGPLISEEIVGIRNVWDAPIAGMFSNAELARATKGNLEMHGFTACTVALKEK